MTKQQQTTPETEIVVSPPTEHTVEVGHGIRGRSSFGLTYYYIDTTRTRTSKGPGQLKGIVKFMLDKDITSPENAWVGADIGTAAVNEGYVVTAKLTGPVIFAYYIRRMEREFGVEHAKTVHAKTGRRMA
jgi:hypothetical protein